MCSILHFLQMLNQSSHDYLSAISSKYGGNQFLPFSQYNPEGYKRMQNEFLEYARYVRNITDNLHYEPTNPAVKNITVLTEGPGGLPLIPPPKLGVKGEETAETAAIIIRQYFIKHFRMRFRLFLPNFSLTFKQDWRLEHPSVVHLGKSSGNTPKNFLMGNVCLRILYCKIQAEWVGRSSY